MTTTMESLAAVSGLSGHLRVKNTFIDASVLQEADEGAACGGGLRRCNSLPAMFPTGCASDVSTATSVSHHDFDSDFVAESEAASEACPSLSPSYQQSPICEPCAGADSGSAVDAIGGDFFFDRPPPTPPEAMPEAWIASDPFELEVFSIVNTVMAVLVATGLVVSADIVRDAGRITIPVVISSHDSWVAESLLSCAKQGIVESTRQACSCAHLLGKCRTPLLRSRQGFQVTLGTMEDPNRACWDLYRDGWCRRGSCCHWKHPERSIQIEVAIEVVEGLECKGVPQQ